MDLTLGNDAPSLRTKYNDFLRVGIRYFTDSSAFTGDYTQAQSVSFGLDVNAIKLVTGNGAPVSADFYLDLLDFDRSADGYTAASVHYKLDTLVNASGWLTFSVTIDDTASASLPAGWISTDPNRGDSTMPAGMTFAKLLSGVDEVAVRPPDRPHRRPCASVRRRGRQHLHRNHGSRARACLGIAPPCRPGRPGFGRQAAPPSCRSAGQRDALKRQRAGRRAGCRSSWLGDTP